MPLDDGVLEQRFLARLPESERASVRASHRGLNPSLHEVKCKFRCAAMCFVSIGCDHGYDTCPICDPCTCPVAP